MPTLFWPILRHCRRSSGDRCDNWSARWHLLAWVRTSLMLHPHSFISAGVLGKASQWQFPTPFYVPNPNLKCFIKAGGLSSYFMVLKLYGHRNYLENMLKHSLLSPTWRISDSVSLGWGQRIHISKKLPENAVAVGPGTILWERLI